MSFGELLCQPIVSGLAMAAVTWLILDFWQDILSTPHLKEYRKWIKIAIAVFNGLMSVAAGVLSQGAPSPRTISLYMPIMITLEIHAIGHMKRRWGAFSVLVLSSFQFITLYSVSVGITRLVSTDAFLMSRNGDILPVTLLNTLLAIFLGSMKCYKLSLKGNTRDREIGDILCDRKVSMGLIIYALINAIAVTVVTYDAIYMFSSLSGGRTFWLEICRNMILRDSILFFSSVILLDLQARNAKSEKKAQDMLARNIMLERDISTQNMIQMGLEAARKELEEKNKKLFSGIEYERRLRKSLHRNILFSLSCNVTKGILNDMEALNIDTVKIDGQIPYSENMNKLMEQLIHPDHHPELSEKMSLQNLSHMGISGEGFNIPLRIFPERFISAITLDDNSARIYAYMDRDYIWTNLDCTVVKGEDGDTYAYIYIMDIDEQKQREEAIQKAATTDALTGLLNRRAFWDELLEYLNGEGNFGGAVFMFDLDFFKSVNDNLGHPKGDELLKDVADILIKTFRSNDIICRLGGDEFCAFAKGFTDRNLIIRRAEELNRKGRKTFPLPEGGEINVSFSIGIAITTDEPIDAEELYKHADSALYEAKEAGRNCYRLYSE